MNKENLEKGLHLQEEIEKLQEKYDELNTIVDVTHIDINYDKFRYCDIMLYDAKQIRIDLVNYEMMDILKYIKNKYKTKLDELKKEFKEL